MKKATVKKTVPKATSPKAPYQAMVTIFGKKYFATGETVREAITNLKPGNCNGRAIMVITKGTVTREKILMPILARRLFNTQGITREIALKNAGLLFNL